MLWTTSLLALALAADPVAWQQDDAQGRMTLLVDGQEALVYRYGDAVDLPHFAPWRSPSGKELTIQQTEPFPHHRSFWFADTVMPAGKRKVSFYNALYTRLDPKDPKSPFKDHIRHLAFEPVAGDPTKMGFKLLWEMDRTVPVLDEARTMRVVPLGGGEYFLDVTFTLTATYSDVSFESDAAHYAWPYVRMHPQFSVDKGGTLVNSEGGLKQAGTHGKPAHWVDYSNTIEGVTEGLAVLSHPSNGYPHTWLTRDYGTFGPRRVDERNGRRFVLKQGETLTQRVGLLVHKGDVKAGQVAERYQQWLDGKL
jgi:hypothetical protein